MEQEIYGLLSLVIMQEDSEYIVLIMFCKNLKNIHQLIKQNLKLYRNI